MRSFEKYAPVEASLKVRFNRPVDDDDYIVPGAYSAIDSDGRSWEFDFHQYNTFTDPNDPSIEVFELHDFDFSYYVDGVIPWEKLQSIEDIYIFYGNCNLVNGELLQAKEYLSFSINGREYDVSDVHPNYDRETEDDEDDEDDFDGLCIIPVNS